MTELTGTLKLSPSVKHDMRWRSENSHVVMYSRMSDSLNLLLYRRFMDDFTPSTFAASRCYMELRDDGA